MKCWKIQTHWTACAAVVTALTLFSVTGLTGCATYDDSNRPSAVDDRPTDPDRQRVEEINRDIGRDTGLLR